MDWIETPESSNVARIGYDETSQVLSVEFTSGITYNY
jgi:KTSC domain